MRTSANSVNAKFAELTFHALTWVNTIASLKPLVRRGTLGPIKSA